MHQSNLVTAPRRSRRSCVPSAAVRIGVEDARRRIAAALERGLAEAVIPASGSASDFNRLRRVLGRDGFRMAPVTGEDGPYSVVYW